MKKGNNSTRVFCTVRIATEKGFKPRLTNLHGLHAHPFLPASISSPVYLKHLLSTYPVPDSLNTKKQSPCFQGVYIQWRDIESNN